MGFPYNSKNCLGFAEFLIRCPVPPANTNAIFILLPPQNTKNHHAQAPSYPLGAFAAIHHIAFLNNVLHLLVQKTYTDQINVFSEDTSIPLLCRIKTFHNLSGITKRSVFDIILIRVPLFLVGK